VQRFDEHPDVFRFALIKNSFQYDEAFTDEISCRSPCLERGR
jgi:hypothetical protein